MAITVATATQVTAGLLSDGAGKVGDLLQSLLDAGSTDSVLLYALQGLSSHYAFDQMRVNRATITAIDNAPDTIAMLASLDDACGALETIQARSKATNDWINKVSSAADAVVAAYGLLTNKPG